MKSSVPATSPKKGLRRLTLIRLNAKKSPTTRKRRVKSARGVRKTDPRRSQAELEAIARLLSMRERAEAECAHHGWLHQLVKRPYPAVYGPASVGRIFEPFGNIPLDLDRQRL